MGMNINLSDDLEKLIQQRDALVYQLRIDKVDKDIEYHTMALDEIIKKIEKLS